MNSYAIADNAFSIYASPYRAIVEEQKSDSTSSPKGLNSLSMDVRSIPTSFDEKKLIDTATFIEPEDATAFTKFEEIAAFTKFEYNVGPIEELAIEISKKEEATTQAQAAYRGRIDELITDAAIDGITLNKASEDDFWTFLMTQLFFCKGKLFLLDNGNLRAVWKSKTGDQLGIQFLGNGTVQFVIFKYISRENIVSRVAGQDTINRIQLLLATYELDDLISP